MHSDLQVTFISQWFAPEPTVVPDGIARAIQRTGARVEVVTGVPNYPTGVVQSGYRAYRASKSRVYNMPVHRTPLYPSHDRSAARRMLNYVSWAVSASIWGAAPLKKAAVNVVYGSPITAALPAVVAKALWKRPYVLIVQDIWPDSVFATGFLTEGLVYRLSNRILTTFTNAVYRQATRIVVISPGMKELLGKRGVPDPKVDVIYNWVDVFSANKVGARDWRSEWGLKDTDFVVMYAGNHGPAQSLASVIEAMRMIPREQNCHLVLVGDGVEKEMLRGLAQRSAPHRVHFVDAQRPEAMSGLIDAADVQLVSLANKPLFTVTIPSKLQAVMAAGKPVLAVAAGDVKQLVEDSGAGLAVTPGDVGGIAEALQQFAELGAAEWELMGERARELYQAEMSENVGTRRYAQVLGEAAREGP